VKQKIDMESVEDVVSRDLGNSLFNYVWNRASYNVLRDIDFNVWDGVWDGIEHLKQNTIESDVEDLLDEKQD